jgi:hypothetical protein
LNQMGRGQRVRKGLGEAFVAVTMDV